MIDEILEKFNLKYDNLNPVERETLNSWMSAITNSQVTVEGIRGFIKTMKASVEKELSEQPEYISLFIFKVRNDKNILLKARLRNYLLIEGFLSSPQEAQKQLEQAIAGFAKPTKL